MTSITSIDDPRFVKAMSHPLRVRILAMLDERKASPNQLAGWLGASLGTVAYHVRTLLQLGLIELVDETRVRGAVEHHYRAVARPTVTAEAWAQASPIAKQAAVGSSLEVIGEYARLSAAAGGFDRPEAQLRRAAAQARRYAASPSSRRRARSCSSAWRRSRPTRPSGIGSDPHAEGVIETGLGLLLFEAARLSSEPAGGAGTGPTREPPSPAARPQAKECPGDGVGRRRGRHRGMRAGAPWKVHGHRSECLINSSADSLSGN